MPLSTLGGAQAAGMAGIQRSFEGIVQPLDAIEARRAKRAAEAVESQKARAAELKAQAAQRTAMEGQAAGEARRAGAAQTQNVMANLPTINEEDLLKPEFPQQIRRQIKAALNSGDPSAMEWARKAMTDIKSFSTTSAADPGTLQGAGAIQDVARSKSEQTLNESMARADVPTAPEDVTQWAMAVVHEKDPGRQGWSSLWMRNYSMEQRVRKGYELAQLLDQVKREYAASNRGQQMPVAQAQAEALSRFEEMEGGTPQGAGAAPAQTDNTADEGFDWSKP